MTNVGVFCLHALTPLFSNVTCYMLHVTMLTQSGGDLRQVVTRLPELIMVALDNNQLLLVEVSLRP